VNNKQTLIALAKELQDLKISIVCIHGDMEQNERNNIMKEFRSGKYRMMLSTDIMARGIDVQQVALVINYDFPNNRENYMHRIGRTGRFGRKGVSLSFITDRDAPLVQDTVEFYHIEIKDLPASLDGIFDQ
jgi:translation initiation factor 4A